MIITQEQLERLKETLAKSTHGEWTLGDENNQSAEFCIGDGSTSFGVHRFDRWTDKEVYSRSEMLANVNLAIDLHNLAPALIAAAEEGLKLQSAHVDAVEFKRLAARNQKEADDLRRAAGVDPDATVSEGIQAVAALQARVRELEEALKDLRSCSCDASPYQEHRPECAINIVDDALSTSQPQEPRFTVDEIIADFQRTANAINREDAPNVKTACEFAIAYLRELNPHPNPRS